MKQPLLIAVLALATYLYFHNSPSPTAANERVVQTRQASERVVAQVSVVAPAPSYHDRWETGPNAQTNLEPFAPDRWTTGPNAQTDFEPFAPSEQAKWNQNPGYTIVAGRPNGQPLKFH